MDNILYLYSYIIFTYYYLLFCILSRARVAETIPLKMNKVLSPTESRAELCVKHRSHFSVKHVYRLHKRSVATQSLHMALPVMPVDDF